jgi:flagellar biosynthesis/type III secretory pathway M-ring protein FliF/YscJ
MKTTDNKEDWALLYECTDEIKLEKIKKELEDASIPYTVINKKDRLFLIGQYEIFVPVKELAKAKLLLKGIDIELE